MNNQRNRPIIVVGVSGSPASAGAFRWAAGEARRRHGTLKVVLIWSSGLRACYAPPLTLQDAAAQRRKAGDDLAATIQAVLGHGPQDYVVAEVAQGVAEQTLVERSAGADLLVLGSGSGRPAGRPVGPVVRGCLSRAHCPVVVVGPEGPPSWDPPRQADCRTGRDEAQHNGQIARRGRALELAAAVPGPRGAADDSESDR